MIEAITFDLWNTIIKNHSYFNERIDIFIDTIKTYDYSISYDGLKKAFEKTFYLYEINIKEIEYRHIYTEERLENLLKYLDITLEEEVKKNLIDRFETVLLEDPPLLKKGVKFTLETLSNKYKIGLISNTGITPGKILNKALEKREILQIFDILSYSDEIGVYKPHKEIFKRTLNNLKTKAKRAVHIGDILETDIIGAKDYGMKAIWVKNKQSNNPNNIKPDFEIMKIPELLDIINLLDF
ncbi:MAG: HAD family hydrolase [Candidatus Lokiarchaeota archaeon]